MILEYRNAVNVEIFVPIYVPDPEDSLMPQPLLSNPRCKSCLHIYKHCIYYLIHMHLNGIQVRAKNKVIE